MRLRFLKDKTVTEPEFSGKTSFWEKTVKISHKMGLFGIWKNFVHCYLLS